VGKTGFFFYIGDYQKDTRCLTAEARGCYVDWLCVLYEFGGTVTWPVSNFAQYAGVSEDTALHVLNQISITNVAEVEWQADSKGIAKHSKMPIAKLSNRRMVREARKQVEIRGKRIEAGRAGGSKRWQNSDSKHSTLLNPSPSPSLNLKEEEKNKSAASAPIIVPDWIKIETWDEWVAHRKRKRAPVTERVADRLFAKLEELQKVGYEPNQVLTTMIDRNWIWVEREWLDRAGKKQEQQEGELSERTQRILRRGL
jgi:uncharacterized protein YdaU (DUF1376 family)